MIKRIKPKSKSSQPMTDSEVLKLMRDIESTGVFGTFTRHGNLRDTEKAFTKRRRKRS